MSFLDEYISKIKKHFVINQVNKSNIIVSQELTNKKHPTVQDGEDGRTFNYVGRIVNTQLASST